MVVYQQVKSKFLSDVHDRVIEDVVSAAFLETTGRYAPDTEVRAWRESLTQMAHVLVDPEIPADVGVGIEFGIPQSNKRIDFMLSGMSEEREPRLVIIELKQWSSAKLTEKDGIVIANRGGRAEREGAHPSYQAWSYAALLKGFNEAVYEGGTELRPCAYLHNYPVEVGVINDPHYAPYTDQAPVFLKGEEERKRLRTFIKQHVKHGDNAELIFKIENGRIRPSKMLVDSLASMLKGNQEFVLIDDQKVVYESCLAAARAAHGEQKQVVIVQGGPGTGKSVVAVNLLAELSKLGLLGKYVSKNAAPRAVFKAKLAGKMRQVEISNLFSGSGAFIDTPPNTFDALIVDEAHRLNVKSGMYENLGEHQIMEIMRASKCSIFFVDDDQMVTLKDIGSSMEIERWAREFGAQVRHLELTSQFRCSGSDGYIEWLDHVLGVRPKENVEFDLGGFDFRIVASPNELHSLIEERNKHRNRARVVAGYCWDWKSRRKQDAYDIQIPEFAYQRRWNLDRDGSLWIVAPDSIDEVGCIHTCQGLELDYVGVIIGPDLVARDGMVITTPEGRSPQDRSIRGYKAAMQRDPIATQQRVDRIIRNTYRTLMTRGMKGCYVYFVDENTQAHFLRLPRPVGS